jgi:hypothetical protein
VAYRCRQPGRRCCWRPSPGQAGLYLQFLRSQAEAPLAADFIETIPVTGARMYILATARPLTQPPEPITNPDRLTPLTIHRRDRLDGILHKYEYAA